ncbi:MAG: hypothetical protein ACYCQJ_16185 [Nitrososphaerales archaeon]
MSATTNPELATPDQIISPEGEHLLKVLSDGYARGDGYDLDYVVDPNASTFSTSCTVDESGRIRVHLSPSLLSRAEAEDRLELLGFAVLHELGHVKRFQAHPPETVASSKDGYFNNIVDDIAINYGNAKRTRFVHDMTKRVYDQQLFPLDKRAAIGDQPRHKQFMESLLVLAMTTNAHVKADALTMLGQAQLGGVDETVVEAVADVLNHQQGDKNYNLLGQLRAYGDDLAYTSRVASVIREHYEELYEADSQNQSSGQGSGDGSANSDGSSFDYSDSAGCGQSIKPEGSDSDGNNDKSTAKPKESQGSGQNGGESDQDPEAEPLDIGAIAEKIAKDIKEALPEAKANTKDVARDFTPEQLERLRADLDLSEEDFSAYMAARKQFAGEIRAVQDILLQLRHERQNEFLSPGREVAAHGHRIKVDRLVRAIASSSLGDSPDIWKHPSLVERVEHEFDGLDLYLLGDVSVSMQGEKARAAAGSALVLQEGLLGASSQMAGEHMPVVRLQIQAFGAGNEMLCKLTDEPDLKDLGRTFSSLLNPTSTDTQVSGALESIKPEKGRLSVVAVVSDGAFHDSSLAKKAGKKLADQNAAIIQLVFGGANVEQLADSAKRINLSSASDLPRHLLSMLPELLDIIRRGSHA